MEYLWNSPNVLPPNSLEFHASTEEINDVVREAILGECRANKYRDSLFVEMVTLTRFMDDRKNKYRSDKGFRTVQKIKKVVERIYQVDLKSAAVVVKSNLGDTFVPSKEVGQWLLIKLQSNALLLHVLSEYCTHAATKLHNRLRTGHNWIEVTMALSMISRIWTLSKFLLKNSLQSYGKLISVLNELKSCEADENWLSSNHNFPKNLKKWIKQSRAYGSVAVDESESQSNSTKDVKLKRKSKLLRLTSKIKTVRDLKLFFRKEAARRCQVATQNKCVSKKLDALQWHMLQKQASKWLKGIRRHEDETEIRIRRIQKKLRKWFL